MGWSVERHIEVFPLLSGSRDSSAFGGFREGARGAADLAVYNFIVVGLTRFYGAVDEVLADVMDYACYFADLFKMLGKNGVVGDVGEHTSGMLMNGHNPRDLFLRKFFQNSSRIRVLLLKILPRNKESRGQEYCCRCETLRLQSLYAWTRQAFGIDLIRPPITSHSFLLFLGSMAIHSLQLNHASE